MAEADESETLADVGVGIGEVLAGKYRLERVIGIGGMGVVVQATHLDLDEQVALKFLSAAELCHNKSLVQRLMREAKAAVKIKSEHVARVSDVGTLDSGAPYIVMEYLDGRDLDEVVANDGAVDPPRAVEYILQAAEAVAQAHTCGIIHRDLKPANLFLAPRPDGSPCVKVLDFGISKVRDADQGTSMTGTNTVMGSPVYMAPEQWVSARNADARSDIWSLGAILYELLAGTQPFEGEGMAQICNQVVNLQPPDLSHYNLDPELIAVVDHCLEKDPHDRFQNVAALAAALHPFATRAGKVVAASIVRLMRSASMASDVEIPGSDQDSGGPRRPAATETFGTPKVDQMPVDSERLAARVDSSELEQSDTLAAPSLSEQTLHSAELDDAKPPASAAARPVRQGASTLKMVAEEGADLFPADLHPAQQQSQEVELTAIDSLRPPLARNRSLWAAAAIGIVAIIVALLFFNDEDGQAAPGSAEHSGPSSSTMVAPPAKPTATEAPAKTAALPTPSASADAAAPSAPLSASAMAQTPPGPAAAPAKPPKTPTAAPPRPPKGKDDPFSSF